MNPWKRLVIFGLSAGVGFALIFAGFTWYRGRPRPPVPWNSDAITASFDSVFTEGPRDTVVFYYILENNTDFDYRIDDSSGAIILSKLEREKSLSIDEWPKVDYPVFLPGRQRIRFAIHLQYPYREPTTPGATPSSRPFSMEFLPLERGEKSYTTKEGKQRPSLIEWFASKHEEKVKDFVNNVLANLDGFVLYDTEQRRRIDFPKGW